MKPSIIFKSTSVFEDALGEQLISTITAWVKSCSCPGICSSLSNSTAPISELRNVSKMLPTAYPYGEITEELKSGEP